MPTVVVVVVVVGARFRAGLPIVWAKIPQSTLFRARKFVFWRNSVLCRMCRWYATDHEFDTRYQVWAVNKTEVYRF
jgi:hypothetical protein